MESAGTGSSPRSGRAESAGNAEPSSGSRSGVGSVYSSGSARKATAEEVAVRPSVDNWPKDVLESLAPTIDSDAARLAIARRYRSQRRRRRTIAVAAALGVVAVAGFSVALLVGGDEDTTVVAAQPDQRGTPEPESSSGPVTPEAPPSSLIEIEGSSNPGGLVSQASVVETSATIIDPGDGPRLCLLGVEDSLPPQCAGPLLVGLDQQGWGETVEGVHWGERSVTITWPPADGAVTVRAQGPPEPPARATFPALPEVCADASAWATSNVINPYAQTLGDRYGGVWVAEGGILVLQVTDDPEPHRATLDTASVKACIIQVTHSERELLAVQDSINRLMLSGDSPVVGSIPNGAYGRVDVYVFIADQATIETIAAAVDDPSTIRLVPQMRIVE